MQNNGNRKNLKYLQNVTCPNVSLSTTNPTWTGLSGKILRSNQLSNGVDVDLSGISVMGINSNVVSQY